LNISAYIHKPYPLPSIGDVEGYLVGYATHLTATFLIRQIIGIDAMTL